MHRRLDQWTTALSALLIVGALLACKKKTSTSTAASAEPVAAAPAPTPPAVTAPAAPAAAAPADAALPKLGDVKRYPDKEKPQTGAVRILEDGVKVFNEADDKTADVAALDKDLLVFRLASLPDWELVEFPSGVGKVSPGWVQAKFLDAKADSKVEREAVASQAKQAVVKSPAIAASGNAAKPSASASAKPAASASASAKPAASATAAASAKPAASATTTAKPATSTAPAPTSTTKKSKSKTAAPATS